MQQFGKQYPIYNIIEDLSQQINQQKLNMQRSNNNNRNLLSNRKNGGLSSGLKWVRINNEYKTMVALAFLCLISQINCFDYDIPTPQILQSDQIDTTYRINYYIENNSKRVKPADMFRINQDVVRVRLGSKYPNQIRNVYKSDVIEVLNKKNKLFSQIRQLKQNHMCNIVKIEDDANGFQKYIINHKLQQQAIKKGEEYFINTVNMVQSQVSIYNSNSNYNSMSNFDTPVQSLKEWREQTITLYSLTNKLQIHKITINQNYSQAMFAGRHQQFWNNPKFLQMGLFNTKTKNITSVVYKPSVDVNTLCPGLQSMLDKYRPDNDKFIQLLQIDKVVLLKCLSIQEGVESSLDRASLSIYALQFNQGTWAIQNNNFTIPVSPYLDFQIYDTVQVKPLKAVKNSDKDKLLVMNSHAVYKIEISGNKLQSKVLSIPYSSEQPNYITMHPARLKLDSGLEPAYLLLAQQYQGLLLVNIESEQPNVELRQNFNQTISMKDIQHISYIGYNNFNVYQHRTNKPQAHGALQLVALQGSSKQYIIQILHEVSIGDRGIGHKHMLHVNKIYHGYHANTNRAHYFKDKYNRNRSQSKQTQQQIQNQQQIQEQQQQFQEFQSQFPENVNAIQKIIHPQTTYTANSKYCSSGVCYKNNNIGIIQSQHKLLFFQYGLPRSLSPFVTSQSQFIKEETYGIISDIDYIHMGDKEQTFKQVEISPDAMSKKIQQIRKNTQNLHTMKDNKKLDQLIRYVVTLQNNIMVLQFDPTEMYHYQYVCNLNLMGQLTTQHATLNDVVIKMEQICQKKVGGAQSVKNSAGSILGYCEQEQTISFDLNSWSIQDQKDWFWHALFITFGLTVLFAHVIIVAVYWKNVKSQIQRLMKIKEGKKNKLMMSTMQKYSTMREQNVKNSIIPE